MSIDARFIDDLPIDGSNTAPCFARAPDGATIAVRLTPKARREQLLGFVEGRCRVAVTAPPMEGKANAALLRYLAKQWGVPKSSLSIAAGATARDKLVHVAGDPGPLLQRLETWRKQAHG